MYSCAYNIAGMQEYKIAGTFEINWITNAQISKHVPEC